MCSESNNCESGSNNETGNEERDVLLFNSLYEICENAYEHGVDSVEIYRILMDTPKLVEMVQKKRARSKFLRRNVPTLLFKCVGRLHKFLFRATAYLFLTVISAVVVFQILKINPLTLVPALATKSCLLNAHPILLEMVRPVEDCKVCTNYKNSNSVVIEFSTSPSEEEFRAVAYLSRPIIIRRAALKMGMPIKFNFAKLKAIFESEPDGVDSASNDCQFLPFRSPFITLRDAFNRINDSATWEKPWYLGWSNCHDGVSAKLREIFPRPKFLPSDSESSVIDWIFVGSPGMGAAMHIDYVKRPSWQAQLSGSKQWILRPPPECDHICKEPETFTINPGDIVFLDTNVWFHETKVLGKKISISIGSEYD